MKSEIRSRISFSEWADKRIDEAIWPFGGKKGEDKNKSSVDTTLGMTAATSAGSGVAAGAKVAGGIAKAASGNILGVWDVIKGSIDAFNSFSNMGTAISDYTKVTAAKTKIHVQLSQQGLPADDIIKVLFEIDRSVFDLFSPALMKKTLSKFANTLGTANSLESETFAACLAAAAKETYGAAQATAETARDRVTQLIKQTKSLTPEVQQKAVQVIQQQVPQQQNVGPQVFQQQNPLSSDTPKDGDAAFMYVNDKYSHFGKLKNVKNIRGVWVADVTANTVGGKDYVVGKECHVDLDKERGHGYWRTDYFG